MEDGAWARAGSPHYTNFEAHTLLDAGQLRLEFKSGAVGYATCSEVLPRVSAPTKLCQPLVLTGDCGPRIPAGPER